MNHGMNTDLVVLIIGFWSFLVVVSEAKAKETVGVVSNRFKNSFEKWESHNSYLSPREFRN